MNSKFLITIIICFILNILLVNSQEAKCPPDCSDASKITETSYLDSNSYNDKKFYENSDPNKWNFNDPNFDYSKIPLAKYKELPYDNPSIDHSRLDPNKYICAMGCCTCTFLLRTTQVKYAVGGAIHPKTGLARIPGNYPPNTLFIATNEGIFIGLPKIDEQSKLDISNVGSATIITNNQKVTLSNGLTIDGRLSFKDNQAYVSKNDELTLEGIKIKPKGNDVLVYFDGQQHQGNYVSYGEKKLIAEGNNFDLGFTGGNKLVKVFDDRSILKGTTYSALIYKSPELLQDDYLYTSIGDGRAKSGKIVFSNKEDRNLLSLLETSGFVRIWNDRNDITIDENRVIQNYYKTLPTIREGSVSMQMIAGEDTNKVYTFDENRRILVLTSGQAIRMDELRQNILEKHHTTLIGFFDETHLWEFTRSFERMEKSGIDFSKYKEIKGKNLEILENDLKSVPYSHEDTISTVTTSGRVNWLARTRVAENYRITSYGEDVSRFDTKTSLIHELGHVLDRENRENLEKNVIEKGKEFGMSLTPGTENKGPNELFPSDYSKKNIREFQADTFEMIIRRPQWFTDPYEGGFDKDREFFIRLREPVSNKVLEQRQAFRDIWLEELKKYKK